MAGGGHSNSPNLAGIGPMADSADPSNHSTVLNRARAHLLHLRRLKKNQSSSTSQYHGLNLLAAAINESPGRGVTVTSEIRALEEDD